MGIPDLFVPVILKAEGEGMVSLCRSGQNTLVACCLMVYISQDSIANRSSFESDLVMSCSPGASKLSDVLEVLFEEPEKSLPRINIGAVYSLAVERDKQVFTDAVHYCMVLLKQSNRFTSQKSDVLSLEATLMGHEMFERIIGINVQMDVETEDEAFAYSGCLQNLVKQEPEIDYSETSFCNEENLQTTIKEEKQDFMPITTLEKLAAVEQQPTNISTCFSRSSGPMVVEIPQETMQDFLRHSDSLSSKLSASNIDDKQLPPSPVSLSGSDYSADHSYNRKPGPSLGLHMSTIPLELKQKVVNLVRENPDWPIGKLRKETRIPQLRSKKQVKIWEKQIDGGGTRYDKYNNINNLTYERFLAARKQSQLVTADLLRQWAIQAARDVYGLNFKFEATGHWIMNFKKLYNLQWKSATGYSQRNEKEAIKAARLAMKKRRTLRSSGRITMDES